MHHTDSIEHPKRNIPLPIGTEVTVSQTYHQSVYEYENNKRVLKYITEKRTFKGFIWGYRLRHVKGNDLIFARFPMLGLTYSYWVKTGTYHPTEVSDEAIIKPEYKEILTHSN